MSAKMSKKTMQIGGLVEIGVAVVGFLWARDHSPDNVAAMMGGFFGGDYVLDPVIYYTVIVAAVLLGIFGLINIVRSVQPETPSEKG